MFLCRIIPSLTGISVILSLLISSSIWFVYKLGKALWNPKMGVLLCFFLSCSYIFIENSRNIWQPYFITPIFILNLLAIILLYIKNQKGYLYFCLLITFLGLHIHLSYLPIFIVSLAWMFWWIIKNSTIFCGLFCFITFSTLFISWNILTTTNPGHFGFFKNIWQNFNINNYFMNMLSSFRTYSNYLLPNFSLPALILTLPIFVGNIIVTFRKKI